MDYDLVRPVRLLTAILRVFRLWPKDDGLSGEDWANWKAYMLQVPFTLLFAAAMWVEVILSDDIQHTSDVLLICLTTTALGAKILNNWKLSHVAQRLLHEWSTQEQFKLRSLKEVEMFQFEHRRFTRVAISYIMCSFGVIPFICIQPLFDIPNKLPFYMWTPFDWHNPDLFWYPFIYQVITIPVICICNVTMDAVNWYFMLHLSLCFRILGERLSSLSHEDKNVREKFLQLVRLHQDLKRQARDIETYVSKSVFTQILVSSLIICFTIYSIQMSPIKQDFGRFYGMLQYLSCMVIEILIPSIYGTNVTYSADKLPNALYNCDWPDMSPQMRRFVLMFMSYLNRPVSLRACGFFAVGLPLFTKTMNQAYSLLALLLNMKK
ncbi:putative odorant receptor 71a isoform X1 [Drosophila bipectinata]|uniref:putative odorant receptor 71a isoform X1 n=1 Tax=Drosophila bipectinata TaxID=42026 RepID=UPI001C892CDE|nr:putative odorant receptor 71a isoform X1 [Drosophila bipectinata]